ncbi:hypothetical protein [Thiomicrorhabdus cannonii]|uniref:hypothetical protein n=1 Tax=Thiomicrorhabdus cannonii TaxID=2748011 RepID=UPI0015BBD931|nr:hypothetical protein [Thiomicrorhabdus cannonii]
MNYLDLYQLHPTLQIWEAAALLIDINPYLVHEPTGYSDDNDYALMVWNDGIGTERDENPKYQLIIKTLIKAANYGKFDDIPGIETPHYAHSEISAQNLKDWALSTGQFKCEYLGNTSSANDTGHEEPAERVAQSSSPAYLDEDSPNYAPDLALAIQAWEAVNNGYGRAGDTFKNRVIYWLEENHGIGRKNKQYGTETNNLDSRASQIATVANPNRRK